MSQYRKITYVHDLVPKCVERYEKPLPKSRSQFGQDLWALKYHNYKFEKHEGVDHVFSNTCVKKYQRKDVPKSRVQNGQASKYNGYVKQPKTYISMTTIPDRMSVEWWEDNLRRNISNLSSNQVLVLNIPDFSLKGVRYIVPDSVKKLQGQNFVINYCGKDEGPITKLLPSLRNNMIANDSIIIVCDDDIVYKPKTFKFLEKSALENKDKVSVMGEHNGIRGHAGFSFVKKALKPLASFKIPDGCIRIDDQLIQWYMDKNNIELLTITYEGDNDHFCGTDLEKTETHPEWTSLNTDNREPIAKKCAEELGDEWSETWAGGL